MTRVLQAYAYKFGDSKTEMEAIVIPFRCFLWMLPLVPAADPYLPECECQNETSISIVITDESVPCIANVVVFLCPLLAEIGAMMMSRSHVPIWFPDSMFLSSVSILFCCCSLSLLLRELIVYWRRG